MKTVAAVSVARSDYGIQLPVLRRLLAAADIRLLFVVSGTHLTRTFGDTLAEIEHDGIPIAHRVAIPYQEDTPRAIGRAMGTALGGFADAYDHLCPDLLLLTGDRYETLAAAAAAVGFALPIAHIHGGEVSEGAIDDQIRHAITKMSHLHFAATAAAAARIVQMGEEAWRVTVCGAPALDNLRSISPLSAAELEARLGIPLTPRPLLVTFHPETLDAARTNEQVEALLSALAEQDRPIVMTFPNADAKNASIRSALQAFAAGRPGVSLVENLGTHAYFSLMACAAAMVGNSSSGLIEAPSFGLPVVNIGDRQRGRERAANVIDAPCEAGAISNAISTALTPAFRQLVSTSPNPYGDGHAAERIAAVLREVRIDRRFTMKRFVRLDAGARV